MIFMMLKNVVWLFYFKPIQCILQHSSMLPQVALSTAYVQVNIIVKAFLIFVVLV